MTLGEVAMKHGKHQEDGLGSTHVVLTAPALAHHVEAQLRAADVGDTAR